MEAFATFFPEEVLREESAYKLVLLQKDEKEMPDN